MSRDVASMHQPIFCPVEEDWESGNASDDYTNVYFGIATSFQHA